MYLLDLLGGLSGSKFSSLKEWDGDTLSLNIIYCLYHSKNHFNSHLSMNSCRGHFLSLLLKVLLRAQDSYLASNVYTDIG